MNKDIVQGHWKEIKGMLKSQWGKFTDDDILSMQGTQEELVGRLQKYYGYEKERAYNEVQTFLKSKGFYEDATYNSKDKYTVDE